MVAFFFRREKAKRESREELQRLSKKERSLKPVKIKEKEGKGITRFLSALCGVSFALGLGFSIPSVALAEEVEIRADGMVERVEISPEELDGKSQAEVFEILKRKFQPAAEKTTEQMFGESKREEKRIEERDLPTPVSEYAARFEFFDQLSHRRYIYLVSPAGEVIEVRPVSSKYRGFVGIAVIMSRFDKRLVFFVSVRL